MRLSKNFRLEEFLRSQTAARHGVDMTPTAEVLQNIQELVTKFLQPIRTYLASPIFITSGYRPYALNRLIGGSETSMHMMGRAADFVVNDHTPLEACDRIRKMELPFDQLIHEFGKWIHLGTAENPRGQMLTAYRENGRTKYVLGLHEIKSLRGN